ncbi:MAG: SLC13 family permease [Peptococcaceae bacterium]
MGKTIQRIGFLLFVAISLVIAIPQLFQPELDAKGHLVLMTLIITIGLWIFKPLNLSFSVSSAIYMAVLLAIGVPASNVFSGFAGTAVWSLIPALFYGFVLAKTGLGKRIAYFGMKYVNISYPGLLLMWMIIGIVLSMLTPSITVRAVIVTPIALNCANICKLAENSKERSLIMITAWAMAVIPGIGWLSGSLAGPIMSGFYASVPELGAIDFASWARVSLLPVTVITILTVIAGYIVLKPSEKLNISKDTFIEEYQRLGAMSTQEKVSSIVLVFSFVLFATNSYHKIPDAAVCLAGLFVLSAAQIINSKEISSGISWDLVLFIGTTMGFGSVFASTGVSKWMSSILVDALAPIAGSPWIFIPVVLLILFLVRFVDIAVFVPTMAIVSSIAPSVFDRYGIDPLVWVPLLCIAMNAFFLSYQNMFALVAEANMGGKGWTSKHLFRFGTAYFIVSMLSMLIVIPYWISIGLF